MMSRKLQHAYSPHGPSLSSLSVVRQEDTKTLSVSKTEVKCKVTELLEELNQGNFNRIASQILGWCNISIDEPDGRTLRQVCELIVEKGSDSGKGTRLHAHLCRHIALHVSNEVNDASAKGSNGKPVSGGLLFRKYLLNRCQLLFEQLWPEQKGSSKRSPRKQGAMPQPIGLIRFISRLYNVSVRFGVMLLNERIVHRCIRTMLSHCSKKPAEIAIESAWTLLLTTAAKLDAGESAKAVDEHILRMKALVSDPRNNSRMQKTLQYIIDVRANGWVPPSKGDPFATPRLWTRQSEKPERGSDSGSSVSTVALSACYPSSPKVAQSCTVLEVKSSPAM